MKGVPNFSEMFDQSWKVTHAFLLPPFVQAYDIVQGSEVFWNPEQPSTPTPPTAVLLHGILGESDLSE